MEERKREREGGKFLTVFAIIMGFYHVYYIILIDTIL